MAKEKIIFWCPNIFDFKGGIQVFCNYFFQDFFNIYPNLEKKIYLKEDRPARKKLQTLVEYNFSGHYPKFLRTLIFSIKLLSSGLFNKNPIIFVMHANYLPLIFILSKFRKIKYFVVIYGIEVWNWKSPMKIQSLRSATAIISISNYTISKVKEYLTVDQSKFNILPCKFSENNFQIADKSKKLLDRHGITNETKVILTICRLDNFESYKGYDQIIESLDLVKESIKDLVYILVGKGNDRHRIEDLIKNKGLEKSVIMTGFIPDEEIVDYYNLCDLFAMPSKGEGFGIVYLEALACGRPVLVSNQDAGQEVIKNGELGIVVDPDNIKELANILIQVLNGKHPNKNIYNREFLRQKVIEYYGLDVFHNRLKKILEQHLN